MIWKLHISFLLSFFGMLPQLMAQEAVSLLTPGYTISAKYHIGFILSHRENMNHLVRDRVKGFDLNLDKQTSGEQGWHGSFNRPSPGVGLLHLDLGNPEQLGTGTALYGYLDLPLIKRDKFVWYYRCGTGIGLISKPFDRTDNYKNTAIGSKVNMFASVLIEARLKIAKRSWIKSGFSFSHFSNAAVAVPNLGINIPGIYIGLHYQIGDYKIRLKKDTVVNTIRNSHFLVCAAPGIREVHPAGGKKYATGHIFIEGAKFVDNRRKLGLGLDVFYDDSNIEVHNRDTLRELIEKRSYFIKLGIHLSHELVFGRYSAVVQMGVYLLNNVKSDGPIYHRLTNRFYVNEKLFLAAGFKTHWAVAENFEFGIGYRLK